MITTDEFYTGLAQEGWSHDGVYCSEFSDDVKGDVFETQDGEHRYLPGAWEQYKDWDEIKRYVMSYEEAGKYHNCEIEWPAPVE